MATLKTVIRIEAQGADDAIRKTRAVGKEVEDFTKKLNRADFSVISDLEKKLRTADFGVGTKATDGLKKVSDQIGLTRQQALTLTYTFNDVAASLASGASPFTILLQQGGQVTQAFGGIRGTVAALTPIVLRLAPAIAAVGAAVAAVSFLKMGSDAAKAAVELRNLAERANVSFEAFQKIAGVASIKGIAKEDTSSGLERLSQALGKAAKSYRELGEAATKDDTVRFFDRLGTDFRGFTGTSSQVERAIRSLSRGIRSLSGQERFDAIQQLRSLVGPDFASFVIRSGRSIEQLAKQYNVAANTLTKADLAIAERQTEAAAQFGDAWAAASTKIGSLFTPATLAATQFLETIRSSGSGTFEPLKEALTTTSDALRDFFLILSGDQAAAQRSPAISALVDGLSVVADTASLAAKAVSDSFDAILIVSGEVAAAINDTFGTKFSAGATAATAAIGLIIAKMTGLDKAIIAIAGSLGSLALAAALNPLVIGAAAAAGVLLTIVANIDSIKAAFRRLGEDFDLYFVREVKILAKFLQGVWSGVKFDGAGYKKGIDEAIALEKQREEAIKQIAARRAEEDKKSAGGLRQIIANDINFVKGLWADSGAQSFMDGVVAQIGKATQSLGGLSGRAKSTIADVRNAGNSAAGVVNDAVQNGFQKVAPGRWKRVFDEAQAEADQFVKVGAGRWKQALDGAQEETNRFVRGADGFWRQVTSGADQATAASQKAAEAIRQAKAEQTATGPTTQPLPAQTARQAPSIQQLQQLPEITTAADKITDIVASVKSAIAEIVKLDVKARDVVGQAAVSSIGAATSDINKFVALIDGAINRANDLSSAVALTQAPTPALAQSAQGQQAPQAAPIEAAKTAVGELVALVQSAIQNAQNFAAAAVILVSNSVTQLANPALASINSLNDALSRAIDNVNRLAGAVAALPALPNYGNSNQGGSGGASASFAGGGLVLGAGTATSDSIPAWLSNGEFVIRAAAVKQYGVDFLRRINRMSISPAKVSLPRFAMGGLVGGGGSYQQQTTRPVTLVLDGKSFGPFTAGGDVIGAVEKHVSMRKISRTTARVPSRIG